MTQLGNRYGGRQLRRFTLWIVVLFLATSALATSAIAQASDELLGLQRQAMKLTASGRYGGTLSNSQRALLLAEKRLGHGHPAVAEWVNHIAYLNAMQGRYKEASL